MGRGGPVKDLNYVNLTMTNVNLPIVIYSYYDRTGTPHRITADDVLADSNRFPTGRGTPVWRDITFSNITAVSGGDIGGIIWGPAEMPITNVTLIRVTNTAPKTFDFYNVHEVKVVDCQFNFASGDTFTLCNAGLNIRNSTPAPAPVTIGAHGTNALTLDNAPASMRSADLEAINRLTLRGSVLKSTGDLTLANSSVQNFVLGRGVSAVSVAGNLSLESTVNIGGESGIAPGNYALVTYTGTLNGASKLGITPGEFHFQLDTNSPGTVRLIVK
jgi:hypothetical protein